MTTAASDQNACVGGGSIPAIRVFTEGDSLYAAMLSAIAGGERRIWLASYILAADEVGQPLLEALLRQARRGLDVRVHVDAFGSGWQLPRFWRRALRQAGVRLRRFHRWSWRRPLRYNRRDHRKLLVVDGTLAFLGGFNIHRQGSRQSYGAARWRDTHVAVHGALATEVEAAFAAFWQGRRRWTVAADDDLHVYPNFSRNCRRTLHCIYRETLAAAAERVWLATPYFAPDRTILRALTGAARRGVDVRLLTTRRTDSRPARWTAHAMYDELLTAGVRVYEYYPRLMHAKTLLVDGDWSSVGTANLDHRSLFVNYELSLLGRDRQLNRTLAEQFVADLAAAEEIQREPWRRRSVLLRLAPRLGYALRRWI